MQPNCSLHAKAQGVPPVQGCTCPKPDAKRNLNKAVLRDAENVAQEGVMLETLGPNVGTISRHGSLGEVFCY